jgi:hypothetical protein
LWNPKVNRRPTLDHTGLILRYLTTFLFNCMPSSLCEQWIGKYVEGRGSGVFEGEMVLQHFPSLD